MSTTVCEVGRVGISLINSIRKSDISLNIACYFKSGNVAPLNTNPMLLHTQHCLP